MHVAGGIAVVEDIRGIDSRHGLRRAIAIPVVDDADATLLNQVILEVPSASLRTGSDIGDTAGGHGVAVVVVGVAGCPSLEL